MGTDTAPTWHDLTSALSDLTVALGWAIARQPSDALAQIELAARRTQSMPLEFPSVPVTIEALQVAIVDAMSAVVFRRQVGGEDEMLDCAIGRARCIAERLCGRATAKAA